MNKLNPSLFKRRYISLRFWSGLKLVFFKRSGLVGTFYTDRPMHSRTEAVKKESSGFRNMNE